MATKKTTKKTTTKPATKASGYIDYIENTFSAQYPGAAAIVRGAFAETLATRALYSFVGHHMKVTKFISDLRAEGTLDETDIEQILDNEMGRGADQERAILNAMGLDSSITLFEIATTAVHVARSVASRLVDEGRKKPDWERGIARDAVVKYTMFRAQQNTLSSKRATERLKSYLGDKNVTDDEVKALHRPSDDERKARQLACEDFKNIWECSNGLIDYDEVFEKLPVKMRVYAIQQSANCLVNFWQGDVMRELLGDKPFNDVQELEDASSVLVGDMLDRFINDVLIDAGDNFDDKIVIPGEVMLEKAISRTKEKLTIRLAALRNDG